MTLATLGQLRPSQVSNRVTRRFRSVPMVWPAAGGFRLVARPAVPPVVQRIPHVADGSFEFLGVRRAFEGGDRWSPASVPRLWAYHLHYFRWLWELPPERGLELIRDWIAGHPPGMAPGWEPYPLSIRVREWLEWLLAHPDVPGDQRQELVASAAHQTRALEKQIEFHLAGNHLLENAITLCWAGLTLEGPGSERWLAKGLRVLETQLEVQVLEDGAHDERSPMYQALLSEALLRLGRVAAGGSASPGQRVQILARTAGRRLQASLRELVHPDGQIALLNDSVLGEAPSPEGLHLLEADDDPPAAVGPGVWALPAAGYAGYRAPGSYLIFDAGPIGPDHQPGHGHADTLSFELSHEGRRLVTDTGVHTYEPGPTRAVDRGTAAHNTLQIDGRDQSELWAAFRCGRRARVIERRAEPHGSRALLIGEYRGPGRGLRSVRHRRTLIAGRGGLEARDLARASGSHEGVLRLHFAPEVGVRARRGGWEVTRGGVPVAQVAGEGLEWREARSPYHPSFGVELERVCLEAPLVFQDEVMVSWSLGLL